MEKIVINSPLGFVLIEGDETGISKISITSNEILLTETIPDLFTEVVKQMHEYFDGNRTVFTFKMNPKGTEFQKKVWEELLKIPYGKTASYQEITNQLGDPKAIRAVANANGKNPLWIVVPCHRVIGSDGSLTGYAGGLWRKKWLLKHENPVKQQSLF
ncbi:methylated-DNA--[protein]-cysteine S-methyltransferase [Flavobacterium urocaniciphilum]|uniref:Methylated-DNA--protein-cysteine methyltransferase n=1 Tax=Flavobacterium urocaniciphilum TaxID=1299341 RepID=A0A1H9DRT6_9FLAO|nr:methylated-DNA--[protein]-cysteine S-methyltransferase [Flavobacterium urocaniciphilum]SEQ16202.1 methylated-DNA-[protein]-cysteine S-methyltransferase [Flavobacterium urocaniciphilum]